MWEAGKANIEQMPNPVIQPLLPQTMEQAVSVPNISQLQDAKSLLNVNDFTKPIIGSISIPRFAIVTDSRKPCSSTDITAVLPNFPTVTSVLPVSIPSNSRGFNGSEEVKVVSEVVFICPKSSCEAHFKTRSGLINHLRHHRTERPLECQQCKKQFSWWGHLVSHVQLVHGDLGQSSNLYSCEICKLKFKDVDSFRQHVHTGASITPTGNESLAQYKCNACQAVFRTLSLLNTHKTKEHLPEDNQFQCPMCVKTFHRKYNLLRHLENHDKNEDPERYYQFNCHVCRACFYRKDHLKRHLVIHDNVKPFECNICKKTFRRNDGLAKHLKRH